MFYVKSQSVNLPAVVTNKSSHVAKRFVDLIKKCERRKLSRLGFLSKVSYRYKKL